LPSYDRQCNYLLIKVDSTINGINIYDAFRPCYQNNITGNHIKRSFGELRRLALRKKRFASDKLSWAPPCVDSLGIDNFLLDRSNRKAMGIPEKVADYSMCNANDDFEYTRSLSGSY
jgi:Serine carboxypeptidase